MNEDNQPLNPKLIGEIKQLSERGMSCSADLFVRASIENYGVFKIDPDFKVSPAIERGAYILSRTPFAGEGQVDYAINKFKELLEDEQTSGSSASDILFQKWSAIESSLTEEEHKKLHTKLIEKFFPEKKTVIALNRGTMETLGGH